MRAREHALEPKPPSSSSAGVSGIGSIRDESLGISSFIRVSHCSFSKAKIPFPNNFGPS